MPITKRLLNRAYALAATGHTRDVGLVLEVIVRQEPNHVEAWEFYLQASTGNRARLQSLGDRIAASNDMLPQIKQEVLEYYKYLLRRVEARERAHAQRRSFMLRLSMGFMLAMLVLLLRDTIPMTFSVSLAVAAAAAWFLADWLRKNGQNLIHSRRAMMRSYAHEAGLVTIQPTAPQVSAEAGGSARTGVRKRRSPAAGRPRSRVSLAAENKVNLSAAGSSRKSAGTKRPARARSRVRIK
jgi:hypothetical protein